MEQTNKLTPAYIRELGERYYFENETPEKRKLGLDMIFEAAKKGDAEAKYLIAYLILSKRISVNVSDDNEYALRLLQSAANRGSVRARVFLNRYCETRYKVTHGFWRVKKRAGALVDFNGVPIKINRKGVFTPVDAVLEYRDGANVLTLSANVSFWCCEDLPNRKEFEQAVLRGMSAWQGDYEVFGGQKLRVEVKLTSIPRVRDSVFVVPATEYFNSVMQRTVNAIGTKKGRSDVNNIISNKRSFATNGFKWSVNSMKMIVIESRDFCDYDEIKNVAKHEFGHTLGLGDLYEETARGLEGVEVGKYSELDSFAISGKEYNLVMCDHNGPISNNDIEMVVLAFRENKLQCFQTTNKRNKVSTALGKGN